MTSLLVVGSGLAGLSAVRAARELGFSGPVRLLGVRLEMVEPEGGY